MSTVVCGLPDEQRTRQLILAIALTAVALAVEFGGGLFTHSLALMSDAGHLLGDLLSLGLTLLAVRLALCPPTEERTYGLHRTEVFAALFNGLTLLAICGGILWEAWHRLLQPPEVKSGEMLIIALIGLVLNGFVMLRLRGHSHSDLNLRSAYIHVIGDLLASVGVVVAAVVIALTGKFVVDPILSIAIGLIILWGAGGVTWEALHILLEGVPRGVEIAEVAEALGQVPGVENVHHLHAWSLCSWVTALSVHVVARPADEAERCRIRDDVELVLKHFRFDETTVEMEGEVCPVGELVQMPGHTNDYGAHDEH